jgi:hypothetical protein
MNVIEILPDSCGCQTQTIQIAPSTLTVSKQFPLAPPVHHSCTFSTPVARDMKDNMYVDNILSGADTELNASQYYDESRSIMTEAKFNLRSWASNSPTLQQKATKDGTIDTTPETDINVLGLRWNTSSDTIHFATKKSLPNSHELITKREVLQHSSHIFDPLGIIAPVTIRAKIFMQQLWQQSIDWDEPLNEQLQQEWLKLAVNYTTSLPFNAHGFPRTHHNSMFLLMRVN